jgi:DNA polymerase-3 subunit chi
MTQVDFYVLKSNANGNRYMLACRIAEKAWAQGHRVLIHTQSPEDAKHMDRLMWTFRDQSFVPHGLIETANAVLNPVLIGSAGGAGDEHEVLVNLADEVPNFFSRFERVAECVDSDESVRLGGRERFRFYRDRGYPLKTHEIK